LSVHDNRVSKIDSACWFGRGEADVALHALRDAVVGVQQVTHHAVDDRFDRLVGEIEDDVARCFMSDCLGRGLGADEPLGAGNDLAVRRRSRFRGCLLGRRLHCFAR
jgi:hypothetical protein